jgi:hypothetical protein
MTRLLAVGLLVAISQTASTRQAPTELTAYVVKFTGPDPADCGRHLMTKPFEVVDATERQRMITCAIGAARDRRPFVAVVQLQGVDSLVFEGFLGTAEGAIYRFSYDSAPCGHAPDCAGRFSISRCDRPVVQTNARDLVVGFGCGLMEPTARALSPAAQRLPDLNLGEHNELGVRLTYESEVGSGAFRWQRACRTRIRASIATACSCAVCP